NAPSRLVFAFIDYFRTLLRSIGLAIVTHVSKDEEPKVLIDHSWRLALSRSTIHLLPACVSMALITLNLQGYFIGRELEGPRAQDDAKLGMLQAAAKIQELLVVSSLGTVIFHVLRSEIVFGDGLPLGLVVSGWSFTSLSYFWSAEFWGGIFSRETSSGRRWRRAVLVFLIIAAGAIALMAGPATAVLMVPRTLDWAVGGGIFWLNGSDAENWPSEIGADYYNDWDCSTIDAQLADPKCPSAGFLALCNHYSNWWNFQDVAFDFQLQDQNLRKTMHVEPATDVEKDSWAYTAHTPSATMQDAVRSMHNKSLQWLIEHEPNKPPKPWNFMLANDQIYKLTTKQVGKYLSGRGLAGHDTPLAESIFNASRKILAVPVHIWHHTASSLGLLLLLNRTGLDHDAAPFNLATCSIDARWSNATIKIQLPGITPPLEHDFNQGRVRNLVSTKFEDTGSWKGHKFIGPVPVEPVDGGPPTKIRLLPSWYDLFSPVITRMPVGFQGLGGTAENQTALERVLEVSMNGYRDYLAQVQHNIATAVADGLSRCGSIPNHKPARFLGAWPFGEWVMRNESQARTMVRRGEPKETYAKPKILADFKKTRLMMKAHFTGYVMETTGWFDYLCVAMLLCHAVIALIHTILVLSHRKTSSAWDSVLEFIALAHKSPAPANPILTNTNAGISSFKTIGAIAWIETEADAESKVEMLRLRIKGPPSESDASLRPRIGEQYNGVREEEVFLISSDEGTTRPHAE
ncbi:hypothetical protein FSARC_13756, partial [Fusarium sarcochroum]